MNELFNVVYSEVQTHQFTSRIYKIIFNFKIALKSAKDITVLRFTAIFTSKLTFQNFSNLAHQICFEVLIYCDSTNKMILISIELTHLLSVSVLHAHFFQMLSVALFSHSFSSSLTVTFINMTISSIFTSAALRYSLFIPYTFMISLILAFKKIDFAIFRFCIHSEREIIEIMLIEIFNY